MFNSATGLFSLERQVTTMPETLSLLFVLPTLEGAIYALVSHQILFALCLLFRVWSLGSTSVHQPTHRPQIKREAPRVL